MRLISAGLKPVIGHNEKSCIVSYYRKFSTKNETKIIELIPKSGINLIINDCTIREKLSIIQFDKYKLPVDCTAEAGGIFISRYFTKGC